MYVPLSEFETSLNFCRFLSLKEDTTCVAGSYWELLNKLRLLLMHVPVCNVMLDGKKKKHCQLFVIDVLRVSDWFQPLKPLIKELIKLSFSNTEFDGGLDEKMVFKNRLRIQGFSFSLPKSKYSDHFCNFYERKKSRDLVENRLSWNHALRYNFWSNYNPQCQIYNCRN